MIHTYFYYSPVSYKILGHELPIQQPVLETLAHDFQATLNRKVAVTLPVSPEARAKNIASIKTAQYGHKAFKKTGAYREDRDDLIRSLLASRTPPWASIRLTVTKQGL